jgi:hypothetical protein
MPLSETSKIEAIKSRIESLLYLSIIGKEYQN